MKKTILITGATDGIGLLAAKKLAEQGHQLLIHGRNQAKLAQISEQLGGALTYEADFRDMGAVVQMARAVLAAHERVDVLINNAGILKTKQTRTAAGRDVRFDVNTLAPYILMRSLLAVIPETGRVLNLSSAAQAPIDIAAMRAFVPMDDMAAYAQSKLAITLWSAEAAREHPNGPAFIAINPGSLLATKMVKEGFGIDGKDLNIGADILVRAAIEEEFASASGMYFDNDSGGFASAHHAASDKGYCEEFMAALAELTQAHINEVCQ
ncbi:short-chain dehydrogenase of unknown substrate specificity [SAR116 cluster alpha proteobacterium HIMB100]|nr:short-chain dehydrogenase of unknown substrate specificity [SAR116 cluster alpha proteobacterium HIMB100]